jgi:hypothetical protein
MENVCIWSYAYKHTVTQVGAQNVRPLVSKDYILNKVILSI